MNPSNSDLLESAKNSGGRQARQQWNPLYERQYALRVHERHPETGEVLSAICMLCESFGRERLPESEGGTPKKRKAIQTVKVFRTFRMDNILSHMTRQHGKRWEEYKRVLVSDEARLNYLSSSSVAASRKEEEGAKKIAKLVPIGKPKKQWRNRDKWLPIYEQKFALQVAERDPYTSQVVLAACSLCQRFGREDTLDETGKSTRKRRQLKVVKFFRTFRVDNIVTHMRSAHPVRYEEYQKVQNDPIRRNEFLMGGQSKDGEPQDLAQKKGAITTISTSIVQNILRGVFSYGHTHGPVGIWWNLLAMEDDTFVNAYPFERDFELVTDNSNGDELDTRSNFSVDDRKLKFVIEIHNRPQFEMIRRMIGLGISNSQCAASIRLSHEIVDRLNKLQSATESDIASTMRKVCGLNLQRLSEIMNQTWGYVLVLNEMKSSSTFKRFMDMRIRLYGAFNIQNFHILAIPLIDPKSTGEYMFKLIDAVLSALDTNYRKKLLGICCNGSRHEMGMKKGVVTKLSRAARMSLDGDAEVSIIWCIARELNGVLHDSISSTLNLGIDFSTTLFQFVHWIRQQCSLIATMKSKCPRLNLQNQFVSKSSLRNDLETSNQPDLMEQEDWFRMQTIFEWLLRHQNIIIEHCDSNRQNKNCPNTQWWVLLATLNMIIRRMSTLLHEIQGAPLAALDQYERLILLQNELWELFNIEQSNKSLNEELIDTSKFIEIHTGQHIHEDDLTNSNPDNHKKDMYLRISLTNFLSVIKGMDLDTLEAIEAFSSEELDFVTRLGSEFVLKLVSLLYDYIIDCSVEMEEERSIISRLPVTFSMMSGEQFLQLLRKHKQRFISFYQMDHAVRTLPLEKQDLEKALHDEVGLRTHFEKLTADRCSKDEVWEYFHYRWPMLETFAGGLACLYQEVQSPETGEFGSRSANSFTKWNISSNNTRSIRNSMVSNSSKSGCTSFVYADMTSHSCQSFSGLLHAQQFEMLISIHGSLSAGRTIVL